MSSIKTMENSITQLMDFDSVESFDVASVSNNPASVASNESADADISLPIGETNTSPWNFDTWETGHFEIPDRQFATFAKAMSEFYRDLSKDHGYGHESYSVITFRTAPAMARFIFRMREMRPSTSGIPADGAPLVYFDFTRNTASVWTSMWAASDLKEALREMQISSTVAVFHQFKLQFACEKEETHFKADCKADGVKFGSPKTVIAKFTLESSTALDLELVEGATYDQVNEEWIGRRKHDGFLFDLGAFGTREDAAEACGKFDRLLSLTPAASE